MIRRTVHSAACLGAFGHAAVAAAWVRGVVTVAAHGMTRHAGPVEGELAACSRQMRLAARLAGPGGPPGYALPGNP